MLAASVFGWFIYWLLPDFVVAQSDDFGYLRSVVETLQHGRPWTDDWLEPWSASFSLLSAGLYRLTGSFHFATYGLLGILAALSFWTLLQLWRARGLSPVAATGVAFLVLTFPSLFWKQVDFTGVALQLPCVLLAVGLAENKRWTGFLIVWAVAIANRQSAITWLALPGLETIRLLVRRDPADSRRWRVPLLVSVGGVLVFGAFALTAHRTHAQTVVTAHAFDHVDPRRACYVLGAAALLFVLTAGIGGFFQSRRAGKQPDRSARFPWLVILPVVALAGLLWSDGRWLVLREHSGYDFGIYTSWLIRLVVALAIVGWLRGGWRLNPAHVLYALATAAPLLFRGALWDYYLIDVAIFGLFCRPPQGTADAPAVRQGPASWLIKVPATAGLMAIGLLQLFTVRRVTHLMIDQDAAVCWMAERAIRDGKLDVTEIDQAPFGYIGWYFYPYFAAHEGRNDPELAGFFRYLKGSLDVYSAAPRLTRAEAAAQSRLDPADPRIMIARIQPIAWRSFQEFALIRSKPRPKDSDATPQFLACLFPLTDAEWTDYIEARGKWAPVSGAGAGGTLR